MAAPDFSSSAATTALAPPGAAEHGRLRSLDGLRAVSILMVLLGHSSGTRGFVRLNFGIGDFAHLGVLVFFVISGFLITTLLMHEYDQHGRISLRLFYARRSVRIFPASYAYLTVIGLLWAIGFLHLTWSDIVHGITYTMNFAPVRSWQVGHLWSLSVEEQFYLLWPLTFAALGQKKGTWAAFGVLLLGIAARGFNRVFLIGTPLHDLEMFPMVADSLVAGCLLALLREQLEKRRWYLRLFHPVWSLALLALVLVLNRFGGYTAIDILGISFVNIAIAVLVHRSVYLSHSPLGLFLNWRPVVFIGVLSYSLYVWQQLFLNRHSAAWINAFPQNILFVAIAAMASYFLLEKPFLALRSRLRAKAD
jgi:peptidoglycan/LPS O-acetylase OafA/YrhL